MSQYPLCYGQGTDNVWDEAVALVLGALYLPHDLPPAYAGAKLTPRERLKITELFRRRCVEKVPVCYLVNRAFFAGMEFYVDEQVVIPRSPMAELIEQQFEPWVIPQAVERILDLCTGSGCIAVACAAWFPHAMVDAVELSEAAFEIAQKNISKHNAEEQIELLLGDLYDPVQGRQYDLIVSNPPYVTSDEMNALPDEFRWEPDLGLAAGENGLEIVREIIEFAPNYLTENGVLVCEVGFSRENLERHFARLPFNWLDFERGGEGVFCLQKQDLIDHL
ncbi:MAG TPA: 50S ribosomal protein L3 N(5)-glutamine methyltransferase [Gammaproteobacteria bacterium]|nr:50S ribosomal protein L3 N(5)-glutamine methyltransferase [Gammaproteobacteria bacterium]